MSNAESVVKSMALTAPEDGKVVSGVNIQTDLAGVANIYKQLMVAELNKSVREAIKARKKAEEAAADAAAAWNKVDLTNRTAFPIPSDFQTNVRAVAAAARELDGHSADYASSTYTATGRVTSGGRHLQFVHPVPLAGAAAAAARALVEANQALARADEWLKRLRDERGLVDEQAALVAAKILAKQLGASDHGKELLGVVNDEAEKAKSALYAEAPAALAAPATTE